MTIVPSTSSSAVLSWSPPVVHHCVVNYTVLLITTNRTLTTNTTSVTIDNLTVGINYSFAVVATDNIGRQGSPTSVMNYIWDGKIILNMY